MKMNRRFLLLCGAVLGLAGLVYAVDGFTDTPMLPNAPWHVHDPNRPQPPRVDAGPGPALPATPPSDAKILFDGTQASLNNWTSDGKTCNWKVVNGDFVAQPGKGSIRTVDKFGDCQLHVEWSEPTNISGEGQGRGNSVVY